MLVSPCLPSWELFGVFGVVMFSLFLYLSALVLNPIFSPFDRPLD